MWEQQWLPRGQLKWNNLYGVSPGTWHRQVLPMDSSVLPASRHTLAEHVHFPSSPNLPNSPTHPQLTSVHQGTQPPILDETLVPSKKSSMVEKPGALSHFVLKLPFLYTFTLKIFALRGHYLPRADVRGGQSTPH